MDEKTKERFYKTLQQMRPSSQISWAMDQSQIQDSFCYRALKEARLLAQELVDEKGQLKQKVSARHAPIYEYGYSDDAFWQHQKKFLDRWQTDPLFVQKFRRFSLPLFHPFAAEAVRWTLDLAPEVEIKDFHIKRAAITACLTPLRQSIGSCFATAPAIEIQQTHLDIFIEDLYELLSRGRLRRVVDGVEYSAPFCLSPGKGDLKKIIQSSVPYFASPGLIRAFEIGRYIPEQMAWIEKVHLSEKICSRYFQEGMNVRDLILATCHEESGHAFNNVASNALLKIWEFTLASYCDIKMEFSKWSLAWCIGLHPQEPDGIGAVLLQALQEKLQESHQLVEKRYQDTVVALEGLRSAEALMHTAHSEEKLRRLKAEGIAKAHHLQACQDLYQEAQTKEKIAAELLKKLIEAYTQHLQTYFQEIYDPDFDNEHAEQYEDRSAGFRLIYKHGRSESTLWTAVYNDEQFIAVLDDFFRAVEPFVVHASQEPYEKQLISEMTTLILHHLHTPTFMESAFARAKKRGRLPWAYSSGGSVDQIASLYFRKSSPLKAETRSIQDELELFTFLIDTMKSLPPSITASDRSLLFQTPTHVCLLLPRASLFQEAWNDSGFTYTWIRDQWLTPAREFYSQQLSKEEQKELYRRLQIEGELRATISLEEFVKELKHLPADLVASFLFQTLPLIPMETCQALLQSMELPPFLSSDELFRLLLRAMPDKSVLDVREYMHELKLAAPTFLFADTNWPSGYFSFIVHPVTKQLEVWKTDLAGVTGAPLPLIKSWFGKETWSIFWN